MVGDFTFEAAIVAKISPSVTSDLITFVYTFHSKSMPPGLKLQWSDTSSVTSALSVDLDEGWTAKIEMPACPKRRF